MKRSTVWIAAALAFAASAAHSQVAGPTGLELEIEAPSWTGGQPWAAVSVPVNGKPAWDAAGVPLRRDPDGRFRATIQVPAGTTVAWKVTRGSWATVEKGPRGEELVDRQAVAPGRSFAHVFHWADDRLLPPPGRLLDLGSFAPRGLPSRHVVVHLPPGYEHGLDRYPVLYALDGQNQLEALSWRAFAGVTWQLDRAADAHAAAGRTPFIAVAIDNTPARLDEYGPSFEPRLRAGGKLAEFARWLVDELKPSIDHALRTKPGPEDTGVIGSSMGGLAALHIGLRHSDRVRRIGALSPSLFWNGEETRGTIAATGHRPLRVWLDMGTFEPSGLDPARNAAQALAGAGFVQGVDLAWHEVRGGRHDEASWAARLPWVLGFLFP